MAERVRLRRTGQPAGVTSKWWFEYAGHPWVVQFGGPGYGWFVESPSGGGTVRDGYDRLSDLAEDAAHAIGEWAERGMSPEFYGTWMTENTAHIMRDVLIFRESQGDGDT